ncbi:MAG: GerMN domain-containing protein [Candidatus Eremiobacteraeota bacterium]|nr:GerMN domain-containing protein [Candidatus Eremiobacteraeota bacterium]
MQVLRTVVIVALIAVAAFVGYRFFERGRNVVASGIAVYYCKTDGQTLAKWTVSVNPNATDLKSVAFYAAAQAVAGPPPGTDAIRFPAGTIVRAVDVSGSTATVNLAGSIAHDQNGSFTESGEFKALVWTLTSLHGVRAAQVTIDGARVPTLPGGHLELDEPLTRQSW